MSPTLVEPTVDFDGKAEGNGRLDGRWSHAGLAEAAAALGLPVEFYQPTELDTGDPSASACETLARVSAEGTALLLPKHKTPGVTVAVAAVARGVAP